MIERFENPFLAHKLTDIGLNAVYKFKTRLLPALEAHEQQDTEPNQLLVSLAALLVYMKPHERDGAFLKGNWQGRTYQIRENDTTLALLETTWGQYDAGEATLTETISALLQADELWGRDLSRYSEKVADCAYGLLNGNPLDVIEG